MGYYTSYTLEVFDTGDPQNYNYLEGERIIAQLRSIYDSAAYALKEDGDTDNATKWYEAHEDIAKFSSQYPQALFVLTAEGESTGDIWVGYYKAGNGYSKRATITLPTYGQACKAWSIQAGDLGDYSPEWGNESTGRENVIILDPLRSMQQAKADQARAERAKAIAYQGTLVEQADRFATLRTQAEGMNRLEEAKAYLLDELTLRAKITAITELYSLK